MKKVGLFILICFLYSFNSFANFKCEHRNYIFLIHGVGGNEDTFGKMKEYLEALDLCYDVFPFEYDTGHPTKDTPAFASDFHQFATQVFTSRQGRPQDKISLIMHSQGGLVGSLWLRYLSESRHPFVSQVDSFITLSTPFWGANIANLGKKVFYTGLDKNPFSPFGYVELNEMSFGSKTINNIYQDFNGIFSLPHIRPLAIGGIKETANILVGEDDLAVPIYSSRPDHYRLAINQSAKRGPASIKASEFKKTQTFKYVTVKSTHFNLNLPGVASIPFECVLEVSCNHPSLPYIVNHLKGNHVKESSHLFHIYRVQIFLENNTKDIFSFKDAKLSILDRDGTWISLLQALKKYRGPAVNKEGKAFTFSGVYLKKGKRVIKVKVSLKGKFERILEIPVEGGHTSIASLKLND